MKFFKTFFNSAKKIYNSGAHGKNWTCNLCGREIFSGGYFCDDCLKTLVRNDGEHCECCGRKTSIGTARCFSCNHEWAVDMARSVFVYEGGIKVLIRRLKYDNKKFLAEIFAPELVKTFVKNGMFADVVTCVPMSEERLFERGFNHSMLLAKLVASELKIPFVDMLKKKKETPHQVGLSFKERSENLHSSFAVSDKKSIDGKCVLLVDDVLTTGATSGEIARILKKSGAKSVVLLTVAATESRL